MKTEIRIRKTQIKTQHQVVCICVGLYVCVCVFMCFHKFLYFAKNCTHIWSQHRHLLFGALALNEFMPFGCFHFSHEFLLKLQLNYNLWLMKISRCKGVCSTPISVYFEL